MSQPSDQHPDIAPAPADYDPLANPNDENADSPQTLDALYDNAEREILKRVVDVATAGADKKCYEWARSLEVVRRARAIK